MRVASRPAHARDQIRQQKAVVLSWLGVGAIFLGLGFVWWPLSLLGLASLVLPWLLMRPGKLLDPLPWLKGLRGESSVDDALAGLAAQGWRVISNRPGSGGDIDRVVVGPPGVFALEVKDWSGEFSIRDGRLFHNGFGAQRVANQAVRAAMDVKELLARHGIDCWVESLVVSTRARVKASPARLRHLTVLELDQLRSVLEERYSRWSTAQVDEAERALS